MRKPLTLKDHHNEQRLFTTRLVVGAILVTLMSAGLVGRMVWLQIFQHGRYTTLSDENRLQSQAVAPPRGLITDRNGVILAANRPDFSVELIPEEIPDLKKTFRELRKLISLDPDDIDRFEKRLHSPRRPWEPIPLRGRLTETEIAKLTVNEHRLPGVRVVATPIRYYPHGVLFSHVIGYVNRLSPDDLNKMTLDQQANYAGTHFYGRAGIERYYENWLHGQVGYRQVETNARGRILRVVEEQPPVPGKNLRLTLSMKVQQTAYDALGDRRGAVVAIDPRDGSVLAFVSRPGFDPNLFVTGITHADYQNYRQDHAHPLFNRALQGQYAPGSTVKPFMGLAGLDADTTNWTRTIFDPGYYQLPGNPHRYRDWKRWGHGVVDLRKAVTQSCDTYFYDLAFRTGIARIHAFLSRFSFGGPTGIDLDNESTGVLPSKAWKRKAKGRPWYYGDTVNTGIGQGFMLVTPLQLANATAILAHHGKQVVPTLNADVTPPALRPDIKIPDPDNWQHMVSAMGDVVDSPHGTAREMKAGAPYTIAAKTGTAQVFSVDQGETYNAQDLPERLLDNALIIAFAPRKNPAIAVAVVIEHGQHGGSVAGKVARKVMDAWLLNDKGQLDVPPPLHRPSSKSIDQPATNPLAHYPEGVEQ